jgi:lipoprotein-anchoring transpeptidase ErfK/SrfK
MLLKGFITTLILLFSLTQCTAPANQSSGTVRNVVVSVADQKLALYNNGKKIRTYKISTSKYGVGNLAGSYQTPIGKHSITEKIGESKSTNAAFIGKRYIGRDVNPKQLTRADGILSRIICLSGLEQHNRNSQQRSIYIHGTIDEQDLGRPASYGCVRMARKDIAELCQYIAPGDVVDISTNHLPKAFTTPSLSTVKATNSSLPSQQATLSKTTPEKPKPKEYTFLTTGTSEG